MATQTTVEDLHPEMLDRALAYVRRSPYRNAIPLSNLTQLRHDCAVVVATRGQEIYGLASYYRALPFPAITFVAETIELSRRLLAALTERHPHLGEELLGAVLPEQRIGQLQHFAQIEQVAPEMQLVAEPETLRPRAYPDLRRLQASDLPAMNQLALRGELGAWSPTSLGLGPAFGAFVDGQLAAMATTRFATTDVIEIGNIVTDPAMRRRGLAAACTSALAQACFLLAPRVYLMVVAENEAAFALYRQLGFWPAERYGFVRFRLR